MAGEEDLAKLLGKSARPLFALIQDLRSTLLRVPTCIVQATARTEYRKNKRFRHRIIGFDFVP
jgi:hypothetical protein